MGWIVEQSVSLTRGYLWNYYIRFYKNFRKKSQKAGENLVHFFLQNSLTFFLFLYRIGK